MNRREALKGTAMILGYALTGSTIATLIQSCEPGSKLSWTPQVISEGQAKTLSALIDRILPSTDTPGGIEVGVDRFIDKILCQVFPVDVQESFSTGIDIFNQYAKAQYGQQFIKLSHVEQDAIISAVEEKSDPLPGSLWNLSVKDAADFPFYRMTKELALIGYFQSERISKEVLKYNPIPGPYIGCLPYSEVGSNWSE
ncbi:gluconate 2-dehydrogenase subunit 3 family protein [Anditalea andensis]|uniref:Gluconate 2-dehydrogenase subunit 3 family protein n=1 Tax=Anditalea andensis TaxID=1048983 RepID=A0A074LDA7_9BACT|nr:gluconate 2-dehydrogenase subunit 3 family protein [Anditalea andensis]KEO71772.1 hypothetical protein EL17_21550 [Anditalea andensis]